MTIVTAYRKAGLGLVLLTTHKSPSNLPQTDTQKFEVNQNRFTI